jgi:tol-pal system protein YbgF
MNPTVSQTFCKSLRCVLLTALAAVAFNAHAGLFDDEEARKAILDLRQKVEQNRLASEATNQRLNDELKKAAEENAQQLRRSILDLSNQIETLKAEIARMRGNDEQLARDVAEVQRKQKDIAQGVDARLSKFEPVKVQVDGREFQAEPDEKRDYEAALATFRKGDFPTAQTQFGDFAKRYPQSGYNPSALFWLGNAQYAVRNYTEAINNFRALYTRTPDHPRAPEAMLGLANSQIEMKDTKGARASLDTLLKTYPQSEAAVAGKERLARLPAR